MLVQGSTRPGLRECFDKVSQLVEDGDPLEVVQEVERYRNLWRPGTVKVVLLAESHVHTDQKDFLEWSYGKDPRYDGRLVRFVYCLGYGEKLVKIPRNPGTSQFWKILYSCIHHVLENHDFAPILKSRTPDRGRRIDNKIRLLQKLREAGIWLVDASIIGINERNQALKDRVVVESWDAFTGPLIGGLDPKPRHIIVIGQGVAKTLGTRLIQLSIPYSVIPQLQGWRKPGYYRFYQKCFEICSKFTDEKRRTNILAV